MKTRGEAMLKMKSMCERCRVELTPDGAAFICSYECTFCTACTNEMNAQCPNCGGELLVRPRRVRGVLSVVSDTVVRRLRGS
jgi:hypothetical protein